MIRFWLLILFMSFIHNSYSQYGSPIQGNTRIFVSYDKGDTIFVYTNVRAIGGDLDSIQVGGIWYTSNDLTFVNLSANTGILLDADTIKLDTAFVDSLDCKLSIRVLSSDTIDFVQTTSIISTDTNYTCNNCTYSWTGPSAFSSTDNENIVAAPGIYYVTVTDDDNGCTAIGYVRVEANFYNLLTENGSGDTYLGLNNVESTAGSNLALGFSAMPAITSGYYNIFEGYETTSTVNAAYENIGIGRRALYALTSGNNNISIGNQSNRLITTGSNNITISSGNGTQITTGGGNIVIGNNVASAAGNISNQLWIDNSNTSTPLILGYFDQNRLKINDTLEVNAAIKYPDGSKSTSSMLGMGEISYFNLTGTTIDIINQSDGDTAFIKAAPATTLSSVAHNFDNGGANNGRLRYTGTATKDAHCFATYSLTPGANNDVAVVGVAKNGTLLVIGSGEGDSRVPQTMGSTSSHQGNAIHIMTQLQTNDYLELYVANLSNNNNILITHLNLGCITTTTE